VTPTSLVWHPSAVVAAYRRAVVADSPWILVDVGMDCTVVAAVGMDELLGLRVIGAATEPEFTRDLRWAVRTLSWRASASCSAARWETSIRPSPQLDGNRVSPPDCPWLLTGHGGVWRSSRPSVVSRGRSRTPVLSFAAGGAVDTRVSNGGGQRTRAVVIVTAVLLTAAGALDWAPLPRARAWRTAERIFTSAMPIPGESDSNSWSSNVTSSAPMRALSGEGSREERSGSSSRCPGISAGSRVG
jgi:hypothetical protein